MAGHIARRVVRALSLGCALSVAWIVGTSSAAAGPVPTKREMRPYVRVDYPSERNANDSFYAVAAVGFADVSEQKMPRTSYGAPLFLDVLPDGVLARPVLLDFSSGCNVEPSSMRFVRPNVEGLNVLNIYCIGKSANTQNELTVVMDEKAIVTYRFDPPAGSAQPKANAALPSQPMSPALELRLVGSIQHDVGQRTVEATVRIARAPVEPRDAALRVFLEARSGEVDPPFVDIPVDRDASTVKLAIDGFEALEVRAMSAIGSSEWTSIAYAFPLGALLVALLAGLLALVALYFTLRNEVRISLGSPSAIGIAVLDLLAAVGAAYWLPFGDGAAATFITAFFGAFFVAGPIATSVLPKLANVESNTQPSTSGSGSTDPSARSAQRRAESEVSPAAPDRPIDETDAPVGSVEAHSEISPGHSDAPIDSPEQDRLDHMPAVRALSEFIRNRGTKPRMTIAITAPWGQGKSSMMRLLQRDLELNRFRTAWFNAWHHQQEGRPLSALLNVISNQALPSFWVNPIAFARDRSMLLWKRGPLYQAGALLLLLLLTYGVVELKASAREHGLSAMQLATWNFRHHCMGEPRVALSAHSLNKLRPTEKQQPVRPQVYEFLREASQPVNDAERCKVDDREWRSWTLTCPFDSRAELQRTIARTMERSGAWSRIDPTSELDQRLLPSEVAAIASAAEVFAPPPLLPKLGPFLSLLLTLLGLIVTKGFSVYGFQLLGPLKSLLFRDAAADSGAEPTGTIERYRTEFTNLAESLHGTLVIFIDDLDRCDEDTVNSVLELTNYLLDQSDCFVVIGAAMDLVRDSIRPRRTGEGALTGEALKLYQRNYLEKLIHIELPVPVAKDAQIKRVIEGASNTDGAEQRARFEAQWMSLLPAIALALLVCSAAMLLWRQVNPIERAIVVQTALPTAAAATIPNPAEQVALSPEGAALPPPPQQQQQQQQQPQEQQQQQEGSPEMNVAQAGDGSADLFALAGTALLLSLVGFGFLGLRSVLGRRRSVQTFGIPKRTNDSDIFKEATAEWSALVIDRNPRRVKRFVNHARLLVGYDRSLSKGSTDAEKKPRSATRDADIVILTALYKIDFALAEQLKERLAQTDTKEALKETFGHNKRADQLLQKRCAELAGASELAEVLKDERLHQLMHDLTSRRGPTQGAPLRKLPALHRAEGSIRPQRLRRPRSRPPAAVNL